MNAVTGAAWQVGVAARVLSLALILAHSDPPHAAELGRLWGKCADLLDDASRDCEEGQASGPQRAPDGQNHPADCTRVV